MTTEVVNQRFARGTVYIGRKSFGMHYGNPFSHLYGTLAKIMVPSREESIRRFDSWLEGASDTDVEPERRAWILANLPNLKGERLACFCKPKPCHGDVLARRADAS